MSGFLGDDDLPAIVDAETDLLTAEASAVFGFPAESDTAGAAEVRQIGRTWPFDFASGRFRRIGDAPAQVSDHDALGVWVETTLRIGRYAYGIFDGAYGIDDVDAPIGELITAAKLQDLSNRIREALGVHDRITSVDNIVLAVEGDTITVRSLEVVDDETNRMSITDVRIV